MKKEKNIVEESKALGQSIKVIKNGMKKIEKNNYFGRKKL